MKKLFNYLFVLFFSISIGISFNAAQASKPSTEGFDEILIELPEIGSKELNKNTNSGLEVNNYLVKIGKDGELNLNNFAHNEVFTSVKVFDFEGKLLDRDSGHVVNVVVPVKVGEYKVKIEVSSATDYTFKAQLTGLNGDVHPDDMESEFLNPITFSKGRAASGAYINFKEDIDFVKIITPYSGSLRIEVFNLGSGDFRRKPGEEEFVIYDSNKNEIEIFGQEGTQLYLEEGEYFISAKGPVNNIYRLLYSI